MHKHHLKYIYFWTLNIYIVLGWLMLPDSAAVNGSNHYCLSVRLEIFQFSSNSLPHTCNYFQPYIMKARLGKTVLHKRLLYGNSLTLASWSNSRSEPDCLLCFPSKILKMFSWLDQSSLLYITNNANESASPFYGVSCQYHFTKSVSS